MNQLIINADFDQRSFSWDQLPAFVRGLNRGAATPPPSYSALRVAHAPPRREVGAVEEDAERWDGLS